MYPQRKKQEPQSEEELDAYTFSDESTKKKIKKHLSDIHDVISENDIKNVKVPGKEKPVAKNKKPKKAKAGDTGNDSGVVPGIEGSPATPWDVLD
jgi:hypothetical protein